MPIKEIPVDALEKIRAFVFDVDGVFTDGGLLCDDTGELYRTFNAKDTFSVRNAVAHGYRVAVITGGKSVSIVKRFATCWVPGECIFLQSLDKKAALEKFMQREGLSPEEVLSCGDDLPDVEMIRASGVGAAPADAVPECLEAADWVTVSPGGKGAVREIIETVMSAQGCWDYDPALHRRTKEEFKQKEGGKDGKDSPGPLFMDTFMEEIRQWISRATD